MSNNGVRKFLDLSTAHLLPKTFDTEAPRDPANYPGIISHEWGEYGWWVWVPDDVDAYFAEESIGIMPSGMSRTVDSVPEKMAAVLRYARAHGCDYILFDRDAAVNPDLPVLTKVRESQDA